VLLTRRPRHLERNSGFDPPPMRRRHSVAQPIEAIQNLVEAPYLTPQYRALLPRMLQLHEMDARDDDGDEPSSFEMLVQAEQATAAGERRIVISGAVRQ
jgi:hypothetical protein